ncbi:MAG: RluA family pseudouridine synthase [Treponema sp.]|nr:RluA family pseudouridine synthase [Treponema sp.]
MNSIPILYENDEIIVINKPSGLAVQGGQGITHSLDVDFSKELGYKIFLVHRLDKDTAGLMLVAKSAQAANKWTKLIAGKEARKEYIAICAGSLKNKEGWIKESLIQHGVEKSASTYYKVEKEWTISVDNPKEGQPECINMSQIRLKLDTGRMHQIRIHLSKQGCPIAGDDQHGNFKLNKILKKQIKIKKLLLASVKLKLAINDKEMTFEIPLPEYMNF